MNERIDLSKDEGMNEQGDNCRNRQTSDDPVGEWVSES